MTEAAPATSAEAPTGVGVVNKCVDLLWAVRGGATSVAEAAAITEVSRPTAHRLVAALVGHGLLARRSDGTLSVGPALRALAAGSAVETLVACAEPVLRDLCAATGESAQLFRRCGPVRICIASAEPAAGLKDAVPVGTTLPLSAGSAAKVLLAWPGAEPIAAAHPGAGGATTAPFDEKTLAAVRSAGHAVSVAEREPGLCSASAPVWAGRQLLAALCVAGPSERLLPALRGPVTSLVVAAAAELSVRLSVLTGSS